MYNVGLVLEGGGMRGIFTAGVLDFFLEKDIEFSQIIGVSAGACHAASFVSKQKGRARDVVIDYINDKRYCSIYSLITTGDMFGAKFAYDDIPNKLNVFDSETYEKRNSRLFAAVTNVETGKAEYIELKDFSKDMDALRASASLPMISKIVDFNGKKYLDGGVSDSIPIKAMESRGVLKSLIVLTQPKGYVKEPASGIGIAKLKYRRFPNLVESMSKRHVMYNETIKYIEEQEAKGNVFVIRPDADLGIGRIEKNKEKLKGVYKKGYNCAKENYEKIIGFMEK